jgi:hypothetical protein
VYKPRYVALYYYNYNKSTNLHVSHYIIIRERSVDLDTSHYRYMQCVVKRATSAKFIYNLFNDVFQWLRLYSVEWKDGKWTMNWKGCGSKRPRANSKYYPGICLESLNKNTKSLSGQLVSGTRVEPRTFQIRSGGVNRDVRWRKIICKEREWTTISIAHTNSYKNTVTLIILKSVSLI